MSAAAGDGQAGPPRPRRDDLPPGIDPLGAPREGSERDAFVMLLAIVLSLCGVIVTLAFVVAYRLNG